MPGESGPERAQAHGEAALVERVEFHEARPSLVEQNIVAEVADAVDDLFRIENGAVIGALLDHRRRGTASAFSRRLRSLTSGWVRMRSRRASSSKACGVDRADQPVGVAVGRQIDGDAARDQQRAVVGGLVVVAVEQHEIAVGDQIAEHDLVGRGRAVEHEIGFFRAKDLRGLFLRLQSRAFVGEKVAQLQNRIVEVVAEDRLAQMLDEDAPNRRAVVEDAAVVAGTGPELVAFFGIVDQRAEERRFQRLGVLLEPRHEVLGDELGRLLGEEHIAVDEIEHFDGNVLETLLPRTRMTMGISSPRLRMRLMSEAALPSSPFLPQSTTMQPMAASVCTAISASSTRRARTT